MSTLVLNTSGISVLKEIEGFGLLKGLFPEHDIVIPEGVLKEFNKEYRRKPDFIEKKELDKFQKRRAEEMDLGRGEREAIILSEDLNALLIIDDSNARKKCKKRGVEHTGIWGIIKKGYIDCYLDESEMRELVESLKNTDFYYEEWLIDWTLKAEKKNSN